MEEEGEGFQALGAVKVVWIWEFLWEAMWGLEFMDWLVTWEAGLLMVAKELGYRAHWDGCRAHRVGHLASRVWGTSDCQGGRSGGRRPQIPWMEPMHFMLQQFDLRSLASCHLSAL